MTSRHQLLHATFLLSPTEGADVDDVIIEWLVAARIAEPDADDSFLEFATSLIPCLADRRLTDEDGIRQRLKCWDPAGPVANDAPTVPSPLPLKLSSHVPSFDVPNHPNHHPFLDVDDDTSTTITATTSSSLLLSYTSSPPTSDPRIESLRQMYGDDEISDEFFKYLLFTMCLGNADEAASHLLDSAARSDAYAAFETYMMESTKQERENEEKTRLAKQRVLQKFDERIEGGVATMSSRSKKNVVQESKIRFRDGKIVATNGAKYIVEDLTEEWDGGSRGRVKTKGKRDLLCRRCGHAVAREKDMFPPDSLTMVTTAKAKMRSDKDKSTPAVWSFANRLGQTFDLVTVSGTSTTNARPVGQADARDSFFPGYVWRNVECPICATPLGWQFQRPHECMAAATASGGGGDGHQHQHAPTPQTSSSPPSRELTKAQTVTKVQTIITALTRCMERNLGYWTVEWCNGIKVSQYHTAREGANMEARKPDYSLGKFIQQHVVTDAPLRGVHGLNGVAMMYVMQEYNFGQPCDETKGPRSTKVFLMCCRGATGNPASERTTTMLSFSEPQTCSYEMVICLPELCEFVDFVPEVSVKKDTVAGNSATATSGGGGGTVANPFPEVCLLPVDRSSPRVFYGLNWDALISESSTEFAWAKDVQPVLGAMSPIHW